MFSRDYSKIYNPYKHVYIKIKRTTSIQPYTALVQDYVEVVCLILDPTLTSCVITIVCDFLLE